MGFLPITGRIPFSVSTAMAMESIARRQRELSQTAQELSTGRRITVPSDNPIEAIRASRLQGSLEESRQYRKNVRQATQALTVTDDMLKSFADALDSARSIAIGASNGTASSAEIEGARVQVTAMIDQLLGVANRRYLGQYVLGGSDRSQVPFKYENGLIEFTADSAGHGTYQAAGRTTLMSVPADSSIGVFSETPPAAPLSPDVSAATRLKDLNLGDGVSLGTIEVDAGVAAPVAVDLSSADSLGDIIAILNNEPTLSGQGVTFALNATSTGLAVSAGPTANITIRDLFGGTTASELGIRFNAVAIPAQGTNLRPAVTNTTPLSLLNGGSGVNTANPIVITNGPYSASVDLSGATTVEDVLNALNGAGVRVRAQISDDGQSISVFNTLSGASLSITESVSTGTTAIGLGILTTVIDSKLEDFNDRAGVGLRTGDDIRITVGSGASYTIDLDGAKTIRDVRQIVLTATAGDVDIGINPLGGILVFDNTVGAGTFSVANIDESRAATDLGIEGSTAGGGIISGQNVHKVRVKGIFDTLLRLQKGLGSQSFGEVGVAGTQLLKDQSKLFQTQGSLGALLESLDKVETQITTALEGLTKNTSELVDADLSETVTRLAAQQAALQAALASGGRLLQGSLLDYL